MRLIAKCEVWVAHVTIGQGQHLVVDTFDHAIPPFTNDRNDAHTMLKKWERCAAESETVVKSYQLKLF